MGEHYVLETIRLPDLLLVLLFESRSVLPKANLTPISGRIADLHRMDTGQPEEEDPQAANRLHQEQGHKRPDRERMETGQV